METQKRYVISFGDSDKYSVPFAGSQEEFEASAEYARIKDAVCGYVKERYPQADCRFVIPPVVMEDTGAENCLPLDNDNLERLKREALRQVEVKLGYSELNANARFAETDR